MANNRFDVAWNGPNGPGDYVTIVKGGRGPVAPASVAREASFEVTWSGPNGPGDYITIVPLGAEHDDYLSYFYTTVGSPGPLKAPEDAGSYEVWYVAGAGPYTVLQRRPITVN